MEKPREIKVERIRQQVELLNVMSNAMDFESNNKGILNNHTNNRGGSRILFNGEGQFT